MKHFSRYIKLLVIPVGFLIFASLYNLLGIRNLSRYERLSEYGKQAKIATVLAKEPQNHQFIKYQYQVGSDSFQGVGRTGNVNPSFDRLKIGDSVIVFYDPDTPNNSILGDPQIWFKQEQNSVYYGSLIVATFVSLILFLVLHFFLKFLKK
jgi:hypothetical protein